MRIEFRCFSINSWVFSKSRISYQPAYLETNLPIPEQVQDLLSRLTLDEKAAMRHYFPQVIGMAATWDKDLILDFTRMDPMAYLFV